MLQRPGGKKRWLRAQRRERERLSFWVDFEGGVRMA